MNRMINMNNYICINDLEIFANHGVFEAEKNLGQKFLISAKLYTDFLEQPKRTGYPDSANS